MGWREKNRDKEKQTMGHLTSQDHPPPVTRWSEGTEKQREGEEKRT